MDTIPQRVRKAAENEGFNSIGYIGTYKGYKAYQVGIIDSDGMFVPIGMPIFLLLQNNQVRYANDEESKVLRSRL